MLFFASPFCSPIDGIAPFFFFAVICRFGFISAFSVPPRSFLDTLRYALSRRQYAMSLMPDRVVLGRDNFVPTISFSFTTILFSASPAKAFAYYCHEYMAREQHDDDYHTIAGSSLFTLKHYYRQSAKLITHEATRIMIASPLRRRRRAIIAASSIFSYAAAAFENFFLFGVRKYVALRHFSMPQPPPPR